MASLYNNKISATYVGLIKTLDSAVINATLRELSDGLGNQTGLFINTSGDFKATGILEFGSLKDTGENITITKFVDEADGIANNDNDTTIPTSAAIIDYVASQVTLEDLDFSGDSGSGSVDLDSQTFAIVGTTNEIETSASGQQLQIGIVDNPHISGIINTDGLDVGDNEKIRLGNSQDLEIYHNGTDASIRNNTGDILISALEADSNIKFYTDNGVGSTVSNLEISGSTGTVSLKYYGSQKLYTTNTGISVTGRISQLTDPSAAQDAATKAYVDSQVTAQDLDFVADGGNGSVDLDSQNLVFNGSTNITTAAANQTVTFNLNSDLTSLDSVTATNLTGNVTATSVLADGVTATTQTQGDNSTKVATTAYVDAGLADQDTLAEVLAVGNTTGGTNIAVSSNDNITFTDTSKALFGDSSDLQIYHNGSNSYIADAGTGSLRITAQDFRVRNSADNASVITGIDGGGVFLYHNGAEKLETITNGVEITGILDVSTSILVGSENTSFTDSGITFKTSGSATIAHNTVGQSIYIKTSNAASLDTNAVIIASDGDIDLSGSLTIAQNLTVNGTTTTVNTQTLAVEDPLISLAKDNAANSVDIGFYGRYNDGSNRYLGLYADASDTNTFKLFKGTTTEPTTTVDSTATGYALADLDVNVLDAQQVYSLEMLINNYVYHNGDINTYLGFPSNDNFVVSTGGNTNLAISSSTVTLSHSGSTKLITSAGGVNITGDTETSAGFIAESNYGYQLGSTGSTLIGTWYNDSGVNFFEAGGTRSWKIGNATNGLNTFFDGVNNRVAIGGITNPSMRLTVDDDTAYGGILVQGNNAPGITMIDQTLSTCKAGIFQQSTTGNEGRLLISSDIDNTGANSTIEFYVDGGRKAYIDENGNLDLETGTLTVQGDEFTLGDGSYQTVLFDTSPSSVIGNGTMEIEPQTVPGSGTANFTTYFKSNVATGTTNHHLQVQGDIISESTLIVKGDSSTTSGPTLQTDALPKTSWDDGDIVGELDFYTSDQSGNAPYSSAFIRSVNSTDAGTLPAGDLVFGTANYNASGGANEKVRLTQEGSLVFRNFVTALKAPTTGYLKEMFIANVDGTGTFAINGASNGAYGDFEFITRKGDSSDPITGLEINTDGEVIAPVFFRAGGNVNNVNTFNYTAQARNLLVAGISGTNTANLYLHRDDVTIVSGNELGNISFSGQDGGSYIGAQIQGLAAASWSSTSCPGQLNFQTTDLGSTTPTTRMNIGRTGVTTITNTNPTSGQRQAKFNSLVIKTDYEGGDGQPFTGFGGGLVFNNETYDGVFRESAAIYGGIGDDSVSTTVGGHLAFHTSSTKTSTPSEKARLTADGNFGVGINAVANKFMVKGGSSGHSIDNYVESVATIVSPEYSDNNYHSLLQLVSVRQSLTTGNGANGYIGFSTIDDSNDQGQKDAGRIAIVNESGSSRNSATALSFWTNPGGTETTSAVEKFRIASSGNQTWNMNNATINLSGSTGGNLTLANTTGEWQFRANGSSVNSMTVSSSQITLNEPTYIPSGILELNDTREYREEFTATGNSTISFDIDMKSIGASGQPFEVFVAFTHYSTTYGAMYHAAYYQRSTVQSDITLVHTYINQTSTNGGAWSVSYVDADTIRISKSAGTHASSGYGYLRVTQVKP